MYRLFWYLSGPLAEGCSLTNKSSNVHGSTYLVPNVVWYLCHTVYNTMAKLIKLHFKNVCNLRPTLANNETAYLIGFSIFLVNLKLWLGAAICQTINLQRWHMSCDLYSCLRYLYHDAYHFYGSGEGWSFTRCLVSENSCGHGWYLAWWNLVQPWLSSSISSSLAGS